MTFAKIIEWNVLSGVYRKSDVVFIKVSCCFIQRKEKDTMHLGYISKWEKRNPQSLEANSQLIMFFGRTVSIVSPSMT